MTDENVARYRAAMPPGTDRVLDRRTLARDQRRLSQRLAAGLTVLDVGCGTGAITRGIAEAVAPGGRVVGLDVNEALIAAARREHGAVPGLVFEVHDIYRLPYCDEFDVVTAARVLQGLAHPADAIAARTRAAHAGGRVLVLDYNHEKLALEPAPPRAARTFLAAFLRWRSEAGMDNALADHLADLFPQAGLRDVAVSPQHEVVRRGEPDFEARAGIWADVAATRGHQMVADGALDEARRAAAEAELRAWAVSTATAHAMYLLAVEGIV